MPAIEPVLRSLTGRKSMLFVSVFTVLLFSGIAYACAPEYDDAHHGQMDRLRAPQLEDFYYSLYYPGDTISTRLERGRLAGQRGQKLENARKFAEALVEYRQALQELNGFCASYEQIRALQERVDVFASLKEGNASDQVITFLTARDGDNAETLQEIVAAKTFLSDNAAYALALLGTGFLCSGKKGPIGT